MTSSSQTMLWKFLSGVNSCSRTTCETCNVAEKDVSKDRRSLRSTNEVGLITCEGIDIVQSDHAPEAGVAQGIFHGDLIRHQSGHQEELEEELKEEVERRVRRDHSSNQTQVRMHG